MYVSYESLGHLKGQQEGGKGEREGCGEKRRRGMPGDEREQRESSVSKRQSKYVSSSLDTNVPTSILKDYNF